MALAPVVRSLVVEIERYLAGLMPTSAGVNDVLHGVRAIRDAPINSIEPQPSPMCGWLDEAMSLARSQTGAALVDAIADALPHLRWITYDGYPANLIGPRFPKAHAFASILGPSGFIHAGDFDLGLFLIAPRTFYRDHHHPAPELYAPLTGPSDWRFGTAAPWQTRQAHEYVWNEPLAVHATRAGSAPFLCVYSWTRDVNRPASLVPASDWDAVEAAL